MRESESVYVCERERERDRARQRARQSVDAAPELIAFVCAAPPDSGGVGLMAGSKDREGSWGRRYAVKLMTQTPTPTGGDWGAGGRGQDAEDAAPGLIAFVCAAPPARCLTNTGQASQARAQERSPLCSE